MMVKVEVGERGKMSGRFCQPKSKQHRLIGEGCVTRSRQVPVGEEQAKNVFGAQLVFSDSVVGLDPVPVPASFRQQVSEESRREWEGWRSTDRQEDSISLGLWCSQTTGLLWGETSEMKQKEEAYFCWNSPKWKLSVFGNRTQCANTVEHTWTLSASSHSVLKAHCSSSPITTASTDLRKDTANFLRLTITIQAECDLVKLLEAQIKEHLF